MAQKITSSNTYSFGKPFLKENNVWNIVPLCQTLFPSVKYCATVSNIVSLCEYVSLCKILCHCVKYFVPIWNIVYLCQILCHSAKYCVYMWNIVPLCQMLFHCVNYCVPVLNIMPLCQIFCPCVKYSATVSKPVSSPSSSSLPRAVQWRERVADAKVPASNRTLILENFTWAEKYFTKMSFLTFVKNSTSVADAPAINRTC